MSLLQISLFDEVPDKKIMGKKPKLMPIEMFSGRNFGFGEGQPGKFEIPDTTPLAMAAEDPRTEEQKEADRMEAAKKLTVPMFEEGDSENPG